MLQCAFLYSDLKPADRIHKVLEEYIFPDLNSIGFKMIKSPLSFARTIGDFEQKMFFQKNRWNSGSETVAFDISFYILFKHYKKWHEKIYGKKVMNNSVSWASGRDIPNWSKDFTSGHWYDLGQVDNEKIINTLRQNINNYGLPFLNNFTDLQNAINSIRQSNFIYQAPLLYDFCFFLQDKKQAVDILTWFDKGKSSGLNFSPDINENIDDRKRHLSNWA